MRISDGVQTCALPICARLADDMVRAVDIGEVVTSPQGQVDMFKAIRASATPQVMLEISKAIFAAPVTRVVLTTPTSAGGNAAVLRSEAHTSELQSLMRISYAVFCLKNNITYMI